MRARGRAPAKCRDGHSEARANERRIGLNEGRERPGCDPPVGDPRLVFSARSISARKLGLNEGRLRPGCDPPVGDLELIFWAHSEAIVRCDLARPRLGQKKPK